MKRDTKELIYKQEAIDALDGAVDAFDDFNENNGLEKAKEIISNLPSAQRWIPVTLETLPNLNSVVVVCGEKGTWDYGTYQGWCGNIHSWNWKKNTIKNVYWWMYKADALQEPYKGGQDE